MKERSLAQIVVVLAIAVISVASMKARTQHEFTFKEYEEFHRVLHPLEHEAVPQKDYDRIRSQANELVRLGNSIVKLGVPQTSTVPEEMEKELKKFSKALSNFSRDAKSGPDSKLQKSYGKVHNSFEKLARLSEELNWGVPHHLSVDCPEHSVKEGDQITLHGLFTGPVRKFTWAVSAGKMIKGEKQDTIVLDTSGLSGMIIEVTVEVDDGHQHLVSTSCKVKVSARQ